MADALGIVRDCGYCRAPLLREKFAYPLLWKRAKFCGMRCFRASQREAAEAFAPNERRCQHCSEPLLRSSFLTAHAWVRARFCGNECWRQSLQARTARSRRCPECGDRKSERRASICRSCWIRTHHAPRIEDESIADQRRRAREAKEAWHRRHPEKRAAHLAVRNAVETGRLLRGPCEKCGRSETQAHHADYSKPLDVVWLCSTHHALIHRQLRTEQEGATCHPL